MNLLLQNEAACADLRNFLLCRRRAAIPCLIAILMAMVFAACAAAQSAAAPAAVTSVELLGVATANQAVNGLGFVVPQANQDWEFAAAAAAGARYVRFQCAWSNVEHQTPPPNNQPASPQFVQDPNCVAGYASAKKYGLSPIVVAAYGPPYHKILTVAISSAASVGDKFITVRFVSGVSGDTLANLAFPYDYIRKSDGSMFTGAHNYQGSFITSVTLLDSTHAKLGLASALTTALPVSNSTTYDINEILYPSATTANANDASQVEFGNYVSFLAQDMAARGLSGQIEIWNEPAWADDSWDARGYLYDNFPSGQTWSPNYGFAANLQARQMPAGVTLNWGGTHKSGSNSLFFGPYQPTPMRLAQPSVVFTSESFHPYGNTPEQMMWTTSCLQQSIRIPVAPSAYQSCTLPGEKADSNFMWAAQYNMAAKALNANAGLTQSITETGIIPPGAGLRVPQARFNMRQFLGYQALGITPVTFYAISDLTQTGDPNYSFVEPAAGGKYTPDPSFTAMSGFMADIKPVSNPPVTSYTASSLAQVSSYSGTYPLTSLHLVGARTGATANSDAFLVWQRSYTPGCATSSANDAASCDSPWIRQASPGAGSVTVNIPTGSHATSVVNVDTRAPVAFTSAGQQITFAVADDPIEILIDPVLPPAVTTLTAQANPSSAAYGNQVVLSAVLAPYDSSSTTTNGETVSFFDGAAGLGAGTLSSGVATLDVTSLSIGAHTLTARYGGDSGFAASTGTASMTVVALAPTLTLGQIADQVYGAGPLTLSASSNSNGAISYSVASGPAAVAGSQVTLTGVGTVVLVASQAAAGNYAAASTQASFNVAAATPSLKLVSITDQIYGSGPITVSASSNSAAAITYSIASGPATITGSQLALTGLGTVVLTASQVAAGNYAAASTQTSFKVAAVAPTLKFAAITDQVYGTGPLTVSALSNSAGAISYAVASGPATVAGNQITLTGTGAVVVLANQAAAGNYAAATSQTSFNVSPAAPALKFAALTDQVYGTGPLTVSVSSNSTGAISYSVAGGPATVAGNQVTPTGAGTVVLIASQVAAGNYAAASAQTSFNVTAAIPTLKFAPIADQVYGTGPLSVSASSNSTGGINYAVASGPATVAGNLVTPTGVGTVVLSASQAAAGNYAAASAQTSFNVTAAIPTLKFAPIADQVYGTGPLSVSASSNST
ncbi:MAG TPA: Ig-like domain-containing protein, partial [Acidobacteriaceae bacterium]